MNENYERIIAELLAENERLRASQNNKLAGDLTDTKIAKLTKRWTRDCENLYVQVSRKGSSKRSWIFKWTDPATGKVRPMGLGPYPDVSIAKARELALHHRLQLRDGKDPRAERDASRYEVRQAAATTKTVREVTMEWFTQKIASKSPAYRDKIYNQLHRYVYPTIGDVPIELMTTHAILYTRPKETVSNAPHGLYDHRHCLHELFSLMWPTARDVAFYYERIFKFAKKAGYFRGENPALWDTIKDLVPDKDDVYQRKNRDWLNYQDLPRFLEKLRAHQDRSVRKVGHPVIADALEVIALTAVRPAEVTQMQWREIDGDTWNVPPEHRKGRRAGRDDVRPIPITKSFREVLDRRRARCADPSGDALVFPSDKNNGKTGVGSFSTFIHNSLEWEYPISPHGFRSTLRDWRRAETEFKDILWQRQVDHRSGFADDDDGARTGDRSGAAYGHDPLLKPRRVMMEAYDDFGTPRLGGDVVVRMPRRRRVDDEA